MVASGENVEKWSRSCLPQSQPQKVLKPGIYRLRISPPYPGRPAPLRVVTEERAGLCWKIYACIMEEWWRRRRYNLAATMHDKRVADMPYDRQLPGANTMSPVRTVRSSLISEATRSSCIRLIAGSRRVDCCGASRTIIKQIPAIFSPDVRGRYAADWRFAAFRRLAVHWHAFNDLRFEGWPHCELFYILILLSCFNFTAYCDV